MNILIVDYTGESTNWVLISCKKEVNIIHTIRPNEQYWSKFIEAREYDAILIFEQGKRDLFLAMIELFNIPNEYVIFAKDINSWILHKWAVYALLKEDGYICRTIEHLEEKNKRKYSLCTVEDISYLGYATDSTIMLEMYRTGNNWSEKDMKIFYELSNKFYDIVDKKYFLDLGANIGTTCIYFQKKIDSNIKILAFEPDPETYKLLRSNFLINEMSEDNILENYGLADEEGEMIFHRSYNNPGANSFVVKHNQDDIKVNVVTLDDYLEQKNINLNEIKYIWIDTEGFEAQLFFGMKKLISTQKIPIFMEWNPGVYANNGTFDEFVNLIVDNFASFIDINEIKDGKVIVHNIIDLWSYKGHIDQTNIFLIK